MTDRPSNADLAAAEAQIEAARTALARPRLLHEADTVALLTAGLRAGLDALGQLREARAAVSALRLTQVADAAEITRLHRALEKIIAGAPVEKPEPPPLWAFVSEWQRYGERHSHWRLGGWAREAIARPDCRGPEQAAGSEGTWRA
jgi:multidrug efflux pump subunit AcrA (membrane-fusion protein)